MSSMIMATIIKMNFLLYDLKHFNFIYNFRSAGSSTPDLFPCERPGCGGNFKCVRHVSFVDCPGHDILMATMLNGAAVMDAALLLIAGNESCPQPQTSEHLAAVEIMQLNHLLILQNKIDIIKVRSIFLEKIFSKKNAKINISFSFLIFLFFLASLLFFF